MNRISWLNDRIKYTADTHTSVYYENMSFLMHCVWLVWNPGDQPDAIRQRNQLINSMRNRFEQNRENKMSGLRSLVGKLSFSFRQFFENSEKYSPVSTARGTRSSAERSRRGCKIGPCPASPLHRTTRRSPDPKRSLPVSETGTWPFGVVGLRHKWPSTKKYF